MKKLVIAEKPSVARDLARVLGRVPKKDDHYENDEWVIDSACLLYTSPSPRDLSTSRMPSSA